MENADVYDDFDYNLEANLELFLEALLAFGTNPYAGKNSRVARSLRARAQRRDRYGRFAKMGPMGFDYFDAAGNQQTARGFYIGPANEEGFLQIYVENDPILGTGIFNVKENNASQYIANLTPEQLKRAGIEVGKDVTGKPISARDRKIIPSIAQLNRQDAPDGWVKNDDGSYTSEDGAYQIVPPTGKGKNWTLYPIKKGKREKGTTHRNMSEAIKKANDLDTESLLTPADQKKLEDLQGDLVATQETETDGDPIAEDAKQEEIATIEDKIENLLQEGKINENPVEEPVDGEEDQAPAQGTKATKTKKEGTTKLSGDVRNPGDETRKRKWAEMSEFSRKARVVVQEYMKKRNAGTATEKDLNDALRQLDGLHGPANLQGAKGFDADVDSLHGLFTELLEIPRTFAFYRNKNKGKPDEAQLNDELKTKIAARQKELSSQVVALMTAIETRGKDNAKYANTPTVDTSTEHEDIATFEAPKYSGGPAKPGRPAGTGKNQIAAKKAEEEAAKQKAEAPAPAPTPAQAGPTPEERKAEAEAKKAEAEAKKAEAEAKKAEDDARRQKIEDARQKVAEKAEAPATEVAPVEEAPATETGKDGGDQEPPATPAAEQPAEEPKKPVITKNADGSITITSVDGKVAQIAKGDISASGNLGLAKVDGSSKFTLFHIPTGLSIPVPLNRYSTSSKGGGALSRSEYNLKRDAKEAMDSLDSAGIDLSFTSPRENNQTIPAMLQIRDWHKATNDGKPYSAKAEATPAPEVDTPDKVEEVAADQANAEQQAEETANPDVAEALQQEAQKDEQALETAKVEPPRSPREPSIGGFTGKIADQLEGVTDPQQVKDIINGQEIVYFDFETTGFSNVPGDGMLNRPHQLGIVKVKDGKIIDRKNIWMNPEAPLSEWSKKNSKDSDGNDVTDEWLATQKSMKDAMQEAIDFIGPDAILGGQNVQFDLEVLKRTLAEQGLEFSFAGTIDSRDLGKKTLPTWSESSPVGPSKIDPATGAQSPSNSLGDLVAFLKGEGYDVDLKNAHNAEADALATAQLVEAILQRAVDNNVNMGGLTNKSEREQISRAEWARYASDYEAYKQKLSEYFDTTQDPNKDERLSLAIPESPERFGVTYPEKAQAPGAEPVAPSVPRTPRDIDDTQDVQAQVQKAIDDGNHPIRFAYTSADGNQSTITLFPEDITTAKTGNVLVVGKNASGQKRNLKLSEIKSPVQKEVRTDDREPRSIDITGDIKAQVEQAIADGNHPITFQYTSASSGTEIKTIIPDSISPSPQGFDQVDGYDLNKQDDRHYRLDKMEALPAKAEEEPATKDEGESTAPNEVPAIPESSSAKPTLEDTVDEGVTEEQVQEADATAPVAEQVVSDQGIDLSKITTRTTDEDYAGLPYMPTEEQRNIIDAVISGLNVSVQALAGSGKTSTLVLLAKMLEKYAPEKRILYLAFNKSVQLEAEKRFGPNVEARTGDSLGWNGVPGNITAKMDSKKRQSPAYSKPKDVADTLGISGNDREDVARDVIAVVDQFLISEDSEITKENFDAAGVNFNSRTLAFAQAAWADANLPDGQGMLRFTNSHATKIWALTNPDLSQSVPGAKSQPADIIFFDEAQDINPVMAKLVRDQTAQKIYVGDSRQAIYGFRGADNELDKVETDITLPMTRTFRFSQALAGPGNRMLSLLKSPYKIIGAGKSDGIVVPTGTMSDADAVLVRTNAGKFIAIMEELGRGRSVGMSDKDVEDAWKMLRTVEWLQGGNKPFQIHEDLRGYSTWAQLSKDVERGKAEKKAEMIFNLINKTASTATLASILKQLVVFPEVKPNLPSVNIADGSKGTLVDGPYSKKLFYDIKANPDGTFKVSVSGGGTFGAKDTLLKPNGVNKFDAASKSWTGDLSQEQLQKLIDTARGDVPFDVVVTTAHKAKGLEWGNLKIGDDFRGPEMDKETGKLMFPEKQELNLAYVALTRAMNNLDPGSLSWVFDYTDETDEDPATPSRGIPEGAIQPGAPVEEAPATPEAEDKPQEITPAEGETAPAEEAPAEVPAPQETVDETPNDVVPVDAGPVGTTDNPVAPSSKVIDLTSDISEPGTVEQPATDNVPSISKDDGADEIGGRKIEVVEAPEPQAAPAPPPSGPPGPPSGPDDDGNRPPKLVRPDGWSNIDFDGLPTLSDDPKRDPRDIAKTYTEDAIKDALKKALRDDSGVKIGKFSPDFTARELFEALSEKKIDARRFVAKEYDDENGNTANIDALNKYYFNQPNMAVDVVADEASSKPERKSDNDLIENTTDGPLDPTPAESTGGPDDSSVIADTYDNVDLKDALTNAVKNDEPAVSLETPDGEVVVVPTENVRDALQKQGTDTNTVIDNALGDSQKDDGVPEDVITEGDKADNAPTTDPLKRFLLLHLLQTKKVPKKHRETIDKIATNKDATDAEIDWANDILAGQPNSDKKQKVSKGVLDALDKRLADRGLIMEAIEAIYPDAKKLEKTGDLIVAERDYTDKDGNRFKYQFGVVRTSDELFYVYARETNLTTGKTRSRRVSAFTHSAVALNNDISQAIDYADGRKSYKVWFTKSNRNTHFTNTQDEGKVALEDGTMEPIHRREEPIHRDLVEAIRSAVNKEEVNAQVIQSVFRHISQFGVSDDSLRALQADQNIDAPTFNKIVDVLNAHITVQYKIRRYGTWVSQDGETPVEGGDVGIHTNEYTKVQRLGVIVRRKSTEWSKGYGYSDYLLFRPFEGTAPDGTPILGKGTSITSKNFEIKRTATGTDGSERRDDLQDLVNVPVSRTALPPRVAPQAPASAPVDVPINRSTPSAPTVEIDGEAKPITGERTQTIQDFQIAPIDAGQLQVGDFIQSFDPDSGLPRLLEVVNVDLSEDGKIKVDLAQPGDFNKATIFQQEWDLNEEGLSGQTIIATRRPAKPEPEVINATDEEVMHLLATIRAKGLADLSPEDKSVIENFTSRFLGGESFSADEINGMLDLFAEKTQEEEQPAVTEEAPVATPTPIPTPTPAVDIAQTIIDGNTEGDNSGENVGLQNVVDEAKIKTSELDTTGEDTGLPKLTGYTIKQNSRGIYYAEGGLSQEDSLKLRRKQAAPPALPFLVRNTESGEVHYYDTTGTRRWGQYGAAGALLRRKKADGTYEYLLGKRGPGLSTEPNKWSTPGGAHDSLADSQNPGFTAKKELGEELGVSEADATRVADLKNAVAPDWNYDYTLFEVPAGTNDKPNIKDNYDIADTGWFTSEEIRKMQSDGLLHAAIDPEVLNQLFDLSDQTETPTDGTATTKTISSIETGNLDDFKPVSSSLSGSNDGQHLRGPDGTEVYAKYQRSDMHAANEVAAGALYDAVGVGVADIKHGEKSGRSNVTFSPIIERTSATPSNSKALQDKIREGFVIDAWLANWDAVLNDNTISNKEGDPVRVDVGGSMLFRARGSEKGSNFGDTVGELDSLLDPSMNPSAASIYGKPTLDELKNSAKKLLSISDAEIDQIVDAAFANVSPANKSKVDELKRVLKARRQYILKKFGLDGNGDGGNGGDDSTDGPDGTPDGGAVATFSPETGIPGDQITPSLEALTQFHSEGGDINPSVPRDNRSMTLVIDGKTYRITPDYTFVYESGSGSVKKPVFSVRGDTLDLDWLAPVPEADSGLSSRYISKERLFNSLKDMTKDFDLYLGDISDLVSTPGNLERSQFNGNYPAVTFKSDRFYTYLDGMFINNGTDGYKVDRTAGTAIKIDSTTKLPDPAQAIPLSDIAKKIENGETFQFGKPPSLIVDGDKVTNSWFKTATPGQKVYAKESGYRTDGMGMFEEFTLDENGIWRDKSGVARSSSYVQSKIKEDAQQVDGLIVGGISDEVRNAAIRKDGESSRRYYVSATRTLRVSLNSDGTPKYTEVTNGATTGDTQWLGSPDGTKPEYDIPISQASVDEFLQGHFVVQDMSGYSAPTRLYKPAVIGQKYDGTDYYDYGSIKRADGAAAKVFYYQDMDGKDLAIELDGYISDSKFVSDSGFEVSLDSLQRNLKASKADPNEPDGFIQIIEPAVSSAKSQTPSSPQERDNFKAEVSRRVSNSEGFLTSNVVDGMSKEQISGFLSYLDDNGADEKSVAKAVILYGAHMNSVTDVERKLYAEAADEVYTAGSARKNRKLKDVFASIPTAFEQTTKEKLKEVGREESAQPLEILSLIMPEIRNLPTVVSSPEKLPESTSERPHIYRGVEPNSRIRASTFHKDWAFSAHPYWGGNKGGKAAGYGNYFSTQYGTASGYAGLGYSSSPPSDRRGERGRIAYAVMKPEAKELETDSESGGKKGRLSSMKKAGYIWLSAYLASQGIAPGTQEFKDFMKKYGSSRMMFDESFFPAARGYDYSRLPSSDGRWVIYSRGMMVVVDPTPKRGSN